MENDMKKVLGAIAITAAMLATTAVAGENRVDEQRAELAKLWGRDTAGASQTADTRKNFTGISSIFGPIEFGFADPGLAEVGSNYGQNLRSGTRYGNGAWSGNFRGGRQHDRAEN